MAGRLNGWWDGGIAPVPVGPGMRNVSSRPTVQQKVCAPNAAHRVNRPAMQQARALFLSGSGGGTRTLSVRTERGEGEGELRMAVREMDWMVFASPRPAKKVQRRRRIRLLDAMPSSKRQKKQAGLAKVQQLLAMPCSGAAVQAKFTAYVVPGDDGGSRCETRWE